MNMIYYRIELIEDINYTKGTIIQIEYEVMDTGTWEGVVMLCCDAEHTTNHKETGRFGGCSLEDGASMGVCA